MNKVREEREAREKDIKFYFQMGLILALANILIIGWLTYTVYQFHQRRPNAPLTPFSQVQNERIVEQYRELEARNPGPSGLNPEEMETLRRIVYNDPPKTAEEKEAHDRGATYRMIAETIVTP